MANLFFVHTPLQLIVAQYVIIQEDLTNNYLIESAVPGNSHFFSIYDTIRLSNLWSKVCVNNDWLGWSQCDAKHPYKSKKRILKNKNTLFEFISSYQDVDSLFFGDQQNKGNQLMSILFSKLGYKIYFFEEGAGHYVSFIKNNVGRIDIKGCISDFIEDLIVYRPVFGFKYAKYYHTKRDYNTLPITARYSIIPFYHESFDKQLKISFQISNNAKQIIDEEISSLHKSYENEYVLYMSDPLDSIIRNITFDIEATVIKEKFLNKAKGRNVLIKFHPRESAERKKQLFDIFKESGVSFNVLGEKINLPVELYLQQLNITEVYVLFSSTILYNGTMFPQKKFYSLLPAIVNECLKFKIEADHAVAAIDDLNYLISELKLPTLFTL